MKNKGGRRGRDPYLERERAKYKDPLPSREFILEVLRDAGVPTTPEQLCRMLEIRPAEEDPFARRIGAMERDGQVIRNRKGAICVVDKLDLIPGRVQGHADGFGFLIPDDGSPDLFLGPGEMRQVLHGDRVVARETGMDRRGRREAAIVEVVERRNRRIVGRFLREHGVACVAPEDKRIGRDIMIPPGGDLKAKAGQVVTVEVIEQPTRNTPPIGRVVEILGNWTDPGLEIEIALRKHDLPHEFSPEIEAASRHFPDGVRKADFKGRKDLRDLPLVTIDGETARDFDDAVYCDKGWRGFRLVVAIADVSHYVQPGDALDLEARERGNSVYFPRRVIPMLPEVLSNGLCSLNPQVDRLAMVCDMKIGSSGQIKNYEFYPAVIHSHARLTYTEVAALLAEPKGEAAKKRRDLLPHLQALEKLWKALAKARESRGAIDFETVETALEFDSHGKIEAIHPVVRNDAHRIIEECMLAANVCASAVLEERGHTALYRVHEGPTAERLENLRRFLGEFGLELSGGDEPKAKDYARLLAKIKTRPDVQLIQTVMLRSLQQAVYSPDNKGHFGLAYESYAHFTSPIRRYPDLVIHRAIKAVLAGKRYSPGDWKALGSQCSATERRADEATRDVVNWLKCYYMQDKVGQSFDGTVSAVTSFGLFVALDQVYVEGLIHISELGSDYFHYDAARHRLAGERTGRRFRLGDRLRVRIARVDLETSRADFLLDEGGEDQEPEAKPKARRRR